MDRRYWGTDWFFDDKGILRFPMTVPPGSAVQIGEPIPFHVQAECETTMNHEFRELGHCRVFRGDIRDIPPEDIGQFQIIVADPPWKYNDQKEIDLNGQPTRGIGAGHHYHMMDTEEIMDLPVADMADKRCMLWLWATGPRLYDAFRVMRAWGFKYLTIGFVWVKTYAHKWGETESQFTLPGLGHETFTDLMNRMLVFGPGYYTGSNVELVLLGRKGRAFKHSPDFKASQVVVAPLGEHSVKPEEAQDRIEEMYPQCETRLELFARRQRVGWTVLGDEVPLEG
jgi:N6-adenosine-specific RNA methylase IME4